MSFAVQRCMMVQIPQKLRLRIQENKEEDLKKKKI